MQFLPFPLCSKAKNIFHHNHISVPFDIDDSSDIYKDKKPHIGINNIRQRLAFLYPENHEFLIQSSPGHGTTIIITIPETDTQPNFSGTL